MKKYLLLLPVFMLFIFSCTAQQQTDLVDRDTLLITITDGTLTREIGIVELRGGFFAYEGEDPDTAKMRLQQVLDNMIEMHVFGMAAEAEGMLEDTIEAKTIEMTKENSQLGELYWQVVINKAKVDSLEIVKDWEEMAIEIHCKHVLVADSSIADSLYNQVLLPVWGTPEKDSVFTEIVMEYSTDEGSKARGGDLDFFSHGRMVAVFDEAAFALTDGGLSTPVKSDFGWHIIFRIESRENVNRRPLEEMYVQLKNSTEQGLQRELADKFIDSIQVAANVEIHDEAMLVLYNRLQENSASNPFGPVPLNFSEEEEQMIFITYDTLEVTLKELKENIENKKWIQPQFNPDTTAFKDGCSYIILQDLLIKAAVDYNVEKLPVVERNINAQIDRNFSMKYIEKFITSKIGEITNDDVLNYYNENLGVEFTLPERRSARIIEMVYDDSLENIIAGLSDGDTTLFDTLAKQYSIHFSARSGGKLGMFPEGRYPTYDEIIFSMNNIGGLSEIFETDSGYFAVIMLENITPKEEIPFEDVSERIKSNITQSRTESLKISTLEELKEKYKINEVSEYDSYIDIIVKGI